MGLLFRVTIITRCYFNVRSKADMSQLNLQHITNNYKVENRKPKSKKTYMLTQSEGRWNTSNNKYKC